ncbi:hypothetical protein [Brevibacillus sp. H7]|uniref:hypothetical protein n=1 Tax=Brevibacillus sp. H7 TaxID=3349138 RepID=UPI00382F0C04
MSNIFVTIGKVIAPGKAELERIHYSPDRLSEEEKAEGFLIEGIPDPERIEGKTAMRYIHPDTLEIFYEYVDTPPTEEEILKRDIEQLKQQLSAEQASKADLQNQIITMQETINFLLGI